MNLISRISQQFDDSAQLKLKAVHALVSEIAIAQGGTVRAVDAPRGAVFELRLPWRAS